MDRLPVVHRQTLTLNVDPGAKQFSGSTAIQLSCSRGDPSIGLHACNLQIKEVQVDGSQAQFQYKAHANVKSHLDVVKDDIPAEERVSRLAALAHQEYGKLLQMEEEPELTIFLPQTGTNVNLEDPMLDATVLIHFAVSSDSSAVKYFDDFVYTPARVRRARALFPCVDTPASAHPFAINVTVPNGMTAAAPGVLQQVVERPGKAKEFRFLRQEDTPPCHICIVAGSFIPTPGASLESASNRRQGEEVTHFIPEEGQAATKMVTSFFSVVMAFFEKLLGSPFPFKALHQVFLNSKCELSLPVAAPGMQLLPMSWLFTDRSADLGIEARLLLARELSKQWFGIFMRPKTPVDGWLLQGLSGWLEGQFVKAYMGKNEYAYRRQREKEAVLHLDSGQAAPLYPRGDPYPWGTMHGTEDLDHPELRRWKASAVISMLERRVGEDTFLNLVERIVSTACKDGIKDVTKRLLGTRDFLKEVGKQGGFRKDITAFHERWIAGQGSPRITAAFSYLKKKNVLEIALQQSGSLAARKSLERAANTAVSAKDGTGVAIVEVQVRQDKTNPASTAEIAVNLGCNVLTLQEIKLSTKQQMKRMKRKRRPGEQDDSAEDEAPAGNDEPGTGLPVSWVRVDPQAELLASIVVLQPEAFWIAQLEHSKDALSQSAAVAGLAVQRPFTYRAMNALVSCLENKKIYCRVRVEAALAIGRTANELEGLPGCFKLIEVYQQRCFSSETHKPAQHRFNSLSEQLVNQGIIMALAVVRDSHNYSPTEVADFLVDLLEQSDNTINLLDSEGFLAILLRACGSLSVGSQQAFDSLKIPLEHNLAHDISFRKIHQTVGIAALEGLACLAAHHPQFDESCSILKLLRQFLCAAYPGEVSTEAAWLSTRLACADSTVQLISSVASCKDSILRLRMLEKFWHDLFEDSLQSSQPAASKLKVAKEAYALFSGSDDCPATRHLAFMCLQRLAHKPPTMYKEPRAEQLAAGPAMSLETGMRGVRVKAEHSGLLSGGTLLNEGTGIKIKLRGAPSMATHGPPVPAVSGIRRASQSEAMPRTSMPAPAPKATQTQASQDVDLAATKESNQAKKNKAKKRPREDMESEKTIPTSSLKVRLPSLPVKVEDNVTPQSVTQPDDEKKAVLDDVLAIMSAPPLPKAPRSKKQRQNPPSVANAQVVPAETPPLKGQTSSMSTGLTVRLGTTRRADSPLSEKDGLSEAVPPAQSQPPEGDAKKVSKIKLQRAGPKDKPALESTQPVKLNIKLGSSNLSKSTANDTKNPRQEETTAKAGAKPGAMKMTLKFGSAASSAQQSIKQQAEIVPALQAPSDQAPVKRLSSSSETPEARIERKRIEKLAKAEKRKDETPEQKAERRAEKKDRKDARRAKADVEEQSILS